MSADSEPVEIVDRDGRVIEVMSRGAMRDRRLPHRSTYVALLRSTDRIVVHRRAEWKDVWPGYWDIAFGGICGVGEPWEDAARRELAEEAGITDASFTALGTALYEDDVSFILGGLFIARSDGELTCPDGEVTETAEIELSELEAWWTDRQVCPDSRLLLGEPLRSLTS